jgi:hypothetical protein
VDVLAFLSGGVAVFTPEGAVEAGRVGEAGLDRDVDDAKVRPSGILELTGGGSVACR